MTFAYGDRQHAVSVLIDHGYGGKIRDTWVTKGAGLRADTEREAARDPLVVFEVIDAPAARLRLERAINAGECPEQPDQVDDVVAHRALLRVFAAVGSPALRAAAGQAAERLRAHDMTDPPWAGSIGAPRVGDCWHYADVGGRQESLTMTFAYGDRQHAVSVLIDHGRGGGIRDTWVTKGAGLRADTEREAARDPLVVFEVIDAPTARLRLERAISVGECPEQPDQVDDVVAHRALLRARLDLLATQD